MHYQKRYKVGHTTWFNVLKYEVIKELTKQVNSNVLLDKLYVGEIVFVPHINYVFEAEYRIRELNKIHVEAIKDAQAIEA